MERGELEGECYLPPEESQVYGGDYRPFGITYRPREGFADSRERERHEVDDPPKPVRVDQE